MNFQIERAVLDIDVKVVFASICGLNNMTEASEWESKRQELITTLCQRYENYDVHSDVILEGYNALHDRAGVKRRKNIPSSENLIRQLSKNHSLTFINQVVDIYNM